MKKFKQKQRFLEGGGGKPPKHPMREDVFDATVLSRDHLRAFESRHAPDPKILHDSARAFYLGLKKLGTEVYAETEFMRGNMEAVIRIELPEFRRRLSIPSGKAIEWWHRYSGDQDEMTAVLLHHYDSDLLGHLLGRKRQMEEPHDSRGFDTEQLGDLAREIERQVEAMRRARRLQEEATNAWRQRAMEQMQTWSASVPRMEPEGPKSYKEDKRFNVMEGEFGPGDKALLDVTIAPEGVILAGWTAQYKERPVRVTIVSDRVIIGGRDYYFCLVPGTPPDTGVSEGAYSDIPDGACLVIAAILLPAGVNTADSKRIIAQALGFEEG